MGDQPVEIAWKLVGTTRGQELAGLATAPPTGCTLAVFSWEPPIDAAGDGKRLIYYKFVVSLAPLVKAFLGRKNQHFEQLFDGLSRELRIATLQVRLTAGKTLAYFATATPRERSMIEMGAGAIQVTTAGTTALAVGKSQETLHDTTRTDVTSNTDPGGSWGVDLGIVSFGGTGDTKQTNSTSIDRNSTSTQDVTQRDASTERSELFSFTTRLMNTLSLLSCTHLGSPDLKFSLWAPPIQQLPDVGGNEAAHRYLRSVRKRSSGLEGVQEFFAVAVAPANERVCIEARLDTVYLCERPKPDIPRTTHDNFNRSAASKKLVLDYLYARYPYGFPIDDLDVDVLELSSMAATERERYRHGHIIHWFLHDESVRLQAEYFKAATDSSGLEGAFVLTTQYKPFAGLLLEAQQAKRDTDYRANPMTFPIVQTLSLKRCDQQAPVASSIVHIQDVSSLIDDAAPDSHARASGADFERRLAESIASIDLADIREASPDDPILRRTILEAAAATQTPLDLVHARELGLDDETIAHARAQGVRTLGGFADAFLEQEAAQELATRRAADELEMRRRARENPEQPRDEDEGLSPFSRLILELFAPHGRRPPRR